MVPVGRPGSHSVANARSVVDVFKRALEDENLINEAKRSTSTLGKRCLPGDLVSTGWDAVQVIKKDLTAEPRIQVKVKRHTVLMNKRRRNA
jgi:hypothetical protein